MRRIVRSTLLAVVLLLLAWMPLASKPAVPAQIISVQRGDVHQVCYVQGKVAYAEETYICADGSGRISRVCVSAGQRVGEGDALVRLEAIADGEPSVIRAQYPFTVRAVYAAEGASVTDGMCLMRISSNEQVICCDVPAETAERLHVGMWGWVSAAGESLGLAKITRINQASADAAVIALVLQPEQRLALPEGAVLDVAIFLAGSDDVLTLPLAAITKRETVWWVHDEICTEIPAEVVLCDENCAWVRLPEGLSIALGEFEEGQRICAVSP